MRRASCYLQQMSLIKPYNLKKTKLGCEVYGIDLNKEVSQDVVEAIKSDVTKHRILIFKNQGILSGDKHVSISLWFGSLESTFYKHPQSPHPDVFRVSNVASEGCTGVGRTGWHIDGSFQKCPFSYSLYHMVSIPKSGDTVFAPLTELVEGLDKAKYNRWNRLWMVSDRRSGPVHPLIYSHPITMQKTLCFHLGMTECFIWDYGTQNERYTDDQETFLILKEIEHEFIKDNGAIQYSHKWEPGDFIISDNLAVGHEASPDTQYPLADVGLRILHRTTIAGTNQPTKSLT